MADQPYEIYRPATHPVSEPEVRPGRTPRRTGGCGGRGGCPNWLMISGICVAIWLVTGAGYFWPMWVILGVGIPALMRRR